MVSNVIDKDFIYIYMGLLYDILLIIIHFINFKERFQTTQLSELMYTFKTPR